MNCMIHHNEGCLFFKIYFTDYSDHCHVYRISNELNARLLQEGWVDKVKDLTKSEMNINESTNFTQILSTVEPKALGMKILLPNFIEERTLLTANIFVLF